ncbi:MAG: hypothetical protein LBU51_01855 [Bacteroidales bacterium]|nr:hypothetical protein [Bacteroidales bacterium]
MDIKVPIPPSDKNDYYETYLLRKPIKTHESPVKTHDQISDGRKYKRKHSWGFSFFWFLWCVFIVIFIVYAVFNDYNKRREPVIEVNKSQIEIEPKPMSKEEYEEFVQKFVKSCKNIDYETIARRPDNHIGDKIKLKGKVEQVIKEENSKILRIYLDKYVGEDNYQVAVRYTNDLIDYNVLKKDKLVVYGTFDGLMEYTTVLGNKLEIPEIIAVKIELIEQPKKKS